MTYVSVTGDVSRHALDQFVCETGREGTPSGQEVWYCSVPCRCGYLKGPRPHACWYVLSGVRLESPYALGAIVSLPSDRPLWCVRSSSHVIYLAPPHNGYSRKCCACVRPILRYLSRDSAVITLRLLPVSLSLWRCVASYLVSVFSPLSVAVVYSCGCSLNELYVSGVPAPGFLSVAPLACLYLDCCCRTSGHDRCFSDLGLERSVNLVVAVEHDIREFRTAVKCT